MPEETSQTLRRRHQATRQQLGFEGLDTGVEAIDVPGNRLVEMAEVSAAETASIFGVPQSILRTSLSNAAYVGATIFSGLNRATGYTPFSYAAMGCFAFGCVSELSTITEEYRGARRNEPGNYDADFTDSAIASVLSGAGAGIYLLASKKYSVLGAGLTLFGAIIGKDAFDSVRSAEVQSLSGDNPVAATPVTAVTDAAATAPDLATLLASIPEGQSSEQREELPTAPAATPPRRGVGESVLSVPRV